MIDFVLNDLRLSLKNERGILMIRDLGRTPVVEITADRIRYKVERVALGVVTLVMKHSQGVDPWTNRSKGLIQTMTRSQDPRAIWVRALQVKGVRKPLGPPSTETRRRGWTVNRRKMTVPHWGGRIIGGKNKQVLRRHF